MKNPSPQAKPVILFFTVVGVILGIMVRRASGMTGVVAGAICGGAGAVIGQIVGTLVASVMFGEEE